MAKKFSKILKIHPKDNIVVALRDLMKGDTIKLEDDEFKLFSNVAAKHKFSIENLNIGDSVYMYGVVVAKAKKEISKGEVITTHNIVHETEEYTVPKINNQVKWVSPNIEKFSNSTFLGFHRSDGTVGTENNWLVIPLVFCQNRNIETLEHAILGGYGVNDITILGVSEVNFSFILPALCFVYITLFGLKTSNKK